MCVNDCGRPRHHLDGRCKPCRRREVWGPAHAETERAKARVRADARRRAERERRAVAPLYFTPPS